MGRLSKRARQALVGVRDDCKSTHWVKSSYQTVGQGGKQLGCFMGLLNCRLGVYASQGSTDPLDTQDAQTGDEWEAMRARAEIIELFNMREAVANHGSIEEWNDADDTQLTDVLLEIDEVLLDELREEVPFAPFK